MKKLSKSDVLDKEAEKRESDWFRNQPTSQHFAVGTFVLHNNMKHEIMGRLGDTLTVRGEDGIWKFLRPYALRK